MRAEPLDKLRTALAERVPFDKLRAHSTPTTDNHLPARSGEAILRPEHRDQDIETREQI
jgi:hypothetical protein